MTQATVEQEQEEALKEELTSIPGVASAHYLIRPEDEGSWAPAWELRVDRFGTEYGVPTRLPKGQLNYYLRKRRPSDGKRRFTMSQPANVLPPGQYECFVGDCRKRVRERWHLVQHIEVVHSQEALMYKPFLDQLREAIVKDNPKLAALVSDIAHTPEEAPKAVPVSDEEPGIAVCQDCGWQKSSRNPEGSLRAHQRLHCPVRKGASPDVNQNDNG